MLTGDRDAPAFERGPHSCLRGRVPFVVLASEALLFPLPCTAAVHSAGQVWFEP